MVTSAALDAYRKALTGGVADSNVVGQVPMARVTLPDGECSGWAVYCRAVDRNAAVLPSLSNRLLATLGLAAGTFEAELDYPLQGGVIYLPPSRSIELAMVVRVPMAIPPTGTRIVYNASLALSAPVSSSWTYTADATTISPVSTKAVDVPFGARAYRLTSTTDPLTNQTVVAVQQGLTTAVLSVDGTTSTNWNGTANGVGLDKSAWIPLVPTAQQVAITNTDAALDRTFIVQFLLAL